MIWFSFAHTGTTVSGLVRLSGYFIMKRFKKFKVTPAAYLLSSVSRCCAICCFLDTLLLSGKDSAVPVSFFPNQSRNHPFKFNCKELRHIIAKYAVTGNVMEKKQTNAKKNGTAFINSLRKTRENKHKHS